MSKQSFLNAKHPPGRQRGCQATGRAQGRGLRLRPTLRQLAHFRSPGASGASPHHIPDSSRLQPFQGSTIRRSPSMKASATRRSGRVSTSWLPAAISSAKRR